MIAANLATFFFFYKHENQLLLIFGIFNTLLLLPLEEYAMAEEPPTLTEEETPHANDNEKKPLMHSQQTGSISLKPSQTCLIAILF